MLQLFSLADRLDTWDQKRYGSLGKDFLVSASRMFWVICCDDVVCFRCGWMLAAERVYT